MSEHPYRSLPPTAFWSRSVSTGFSATDVAASDQPLLRPGDRVMSAGSCFASNLIPWIEAAGLEYVRTENPHPAFAHLPENLGYRNFSAAYGNLYTARQLRQLLERCLGLFAPIEDRWHAGESVIDPFRPGLRYPASSDAEFDVLTAQHLAATLLAFDTATVLVFTLGLTEAWISRADGAVFPAAPGTVAGVFDPAAHEFRNFAVAEIAADLREFVRLLRQRNPEVRVILTVSPVPLVATAGGAHVLVASTYSKSVLRVAAGEVAAELPGVTYFPAYEIVTGPQAPADYFAADRRNVSEAGVAAVMTALLAASGMSAGDAGATSGVSPEVASTAAVLSQAITDADCEEVMADR